MAVAAKRHWCSPPTMALELVSVHDRHIAKKKERLLASLLVDIANKITQLTATSTECVDIRLGVDCDEDGGALT